LGKSGSFFTVSRGY